jgi:hypothetical protein
MGNGQAAVCLVTDVYGPTYVYKVPGVLSSAQTSAVTTLVPQMTVFPNPARISAEITLAGAAPAQVRVFDVEGRLVLMQDARKGPLTLDVGGFRNGVYLIRAEIGGKAICKKLLVQK